MSEKDRFGLYPEDRRCQRSNGAKLASEGGPGQRICARAEGHSGPHQSITDDSMWDNDGFPYGIPNAPQTHPDDDEHNIAKAIKATSQAEKMRRQGGLLGADGFNPAIAFISGTPLPWGFSGPTEPEPYVSVTVSEADAKDVITIRIENPPNPQSKRIATEVLPKAIQLYLKKSQDYGGNVMDRFGLGPKACIPDMARKFGKLIDSIWHGKKLKFEQEEEILQDLLGHIFITLDEIQQST